MMIDETTENGSGVHRTPGEVIWTEGEEAKPLRIEQGVVAYRKGDAAVGMMGPGHVALPLPGIAAAGRAASDLVAVTEFRGSEVDLDAQPLSNEELAVSVKAIL